MWVLRLFQVYCVGPQLADASFAEPVPWTEVAKAHISPLSSSALASRAWAKARGGTPATIVSYLNHKHASASLEKLAPPTSGIGLQLATGPREESGGSVRGGAPHRRSEEGGGGTLGVTRTGGSDASTARPSSGKGQWQSYKFGLQHVAGSFLGWSFFFCLVTVSVDRRQHPAEFTICARHDVLLEASRYLCGPCFRRVRIGIVDEAHLSRNGLSILSRRIHGRVGCFGNG